jgi:hypothetical protein
VKQAQVKCSGGGACGANAEYLGQAMRERVEQLMQQQAAAQRAQSCRHHMN